MGVYTTNIMTTASFCGMVHAKTEIRAFEKESVQEGKAMFTAMFITKLDSERHDAPLGNERGYHFVRTSRIMQMKQGRMPASCPG